MSFSIVNNLDATPLLFIAAVNQACAKASAKGTWRLRDLKALMESRETQSQLDFQESHPLIRNLKEYGIFIRQQTHDPTS